MSHFCSSCGKPIESDMAFCPNCGKGLKAESQHHSFSINSIGSTLSLSAVDRPQGIDWLAIAISGLSCFYMVSIAFVVSKIYGIIFAGLLIYKRDVIKKALWHSNIFKPFIIHFAWGAIVIAAILDIFHDATRHPYGFISGTTLLLTLMLLFLAGNAVYYVGYRVICYFYKASKPQGQFVRLMVSMGIILAYAIAKRDAKALDSLLSSDDLVTSSVATATPDINSVDIVPDTSMDMNSTEISTASNTDISDITNTSDVAVANSNTDIVEATPPTTNTAPIDVASTPNNDMTQTQFNTINTSVDTTDNNKTIKVTDSMSQPTETIVMHPDGTADFYDNNMQPDGHIVSGGYILDELNMPEGKIEGNRILDENMQVAYTIEGDTVFDKYHMPAYTIKDGHIFDKNFKPIGSIE